MSSEPAISIEDLIGQMKTYLPEEAAAAAEKAYRFAAAAHTGQRRVSGAEYISHPLGVAKILADLQLDAVSISAALLHDVVEDTAVSAEELEKQFGKEVAMLVDGVTKLSRIEYKSKEEQQLENYRKMFLAMAKDIRVVLIKLADRLHNMRTLKFMSAEQQREKARETLEIFAPLAHRLGIFRVKWELEDLSFRYLEPDSYYKLVDDVKQKRAEREEMIDEAVALLRERLEAMGIKAEIQGRPKNFYSIFKKMQKDHKDLGEIYDLSAVRVVVDNVKDCYGALGIVHTLWKPLPYRFKDFIAMPKSNLYQSLHTTVIGPSGQPLEIQIRTWEMHRISEYGIAAHWRYKEGGKTADKDYEQKLSWLRQLLEWQQDLKDPREFMETVRLDVLTDEVFVFTPRGDVIDLPAGSNPIDFAYRVHTEVGHRCTGARVNNKMVPLETKLNNGDIVEIITSKQGGPSRDWLNIVASNETKNKIRQWFKKEKREENVAKGREMLEKESRRLGFELSELAKGDRLEEVARKLNWGSVDDLVAALGYGGQSLPGVMTKLVESFRKAQRAAAPADLATAVGEIKPKRTKSKSSHGILVKGEAGVMVRLARCCNPVPGDEIVGYITRGRGVSVHRTDCPNLLGSREEFERMIEVEWDVTPDSLYRVPIEIACVDRAGVLSEILMLASEAKINVSSVKATTHKTKLATIYLSLEVSTLSQLENIIGKMRRVKDVYSVQRAAPTVGGTL